MTRFGCVNNGKLQLSAENLALAKALYSAGSSRYSIAQDVGVCESTLTRILRENGVLSGRPRPKRPRRIFKPESEEELLKMKALYESGHSSNAISKIFRRPPVTVLWWLRKQGVKIRSSARGNRKRGPSSATWKGGRSIDDKGYVTILAHGMGYRRNRVLEHRFVMERYLLESHPDHPALINGRLSGGWHVHHVNSDRQDNRLENLMLVNPSDHNKLHASLELAVRIAHDKILNLENRIGELTKLVDELKQQSVYAE